jgi:SAM-dependent methyltransferase
MSREAKEARALSFGSVADAYERARPGYPDGAVRWLTAGARSIVDLGAGTGKLTRQLVGSGREVVAVEPSEQMLALLRRLVPGARALAGSAEEIPLPDASADAVVAAQAFHWFDHARALPELARVLRPGGRLALVWNVRDDSEPWVARLSELIGNEGVASMGIVELLEASGLFEPVEQRTFAHVQRVGRVALLELVSSRSHCATRAPAERERVLAAVEALYDAAGGGDALVLPYRTLAFRTRRRS